MWVLLIPVVTLLVALVWSATRGRPRHAREAVTTIEGYRRMVDALERPVSAPGDAPVTGQAGSEPAGEAADGRHVRVPDVLRGLRRSPRQAPRAARPSENLEADPLTGRDVVYPGDREAPTGPSASASGATPPDAVIPATRAVADPADEADDHAPAGREVPARAEVPADGG
jgi:hypothetical protein